MSYKKNEMEEKNMNVKHKEMTLWSSGDENAKYEKTNILIYSVVFLLVIFMHILAFISNIIIGLFLLVILGWLSLLLVSTITNSLVFIKKNKLITLYLYNFSDFMKLGEVSENMVVIHISNSGAVLALKEFEEESRHFCFGYDHFYEFEKLYNDKRVVEKREILVDDLKLTERSTKNCMK